MSALVALAWLVGGSAYLGVGFALLVWTDDTMGDLGGFAPFVVIGWPVVLIATVAGRAASKALDKLK